MTRTPQQGERSWTTVALSYGTTLVLLVALAVLFQQNRMLQRELQRLRTAGVAAGDLLPDVDLLPAGGVRMGLHSLAREAPVVLAVLTTTCPFCTNNLDAWQRLSTTLEPDQFVALTLDPVAETQTWLAANGHSWPVVRLPRSALRTLGLSGVPTTLVLSTEGEVLFAQNGMLREDDVASVRPFVSTH